MFYIFPGYVVHMSVMIKSRWEIVPLSVRGFGWSTSSFCRISSDVHLYAISASQPAAFRRFITLWVVSMRLLPRLYDAYLRPRS